MTSSLGRAERTVRGMRKRTTTDRDSGYGPRAGAFLVVAVVLAPNVLTGCGGSNPAAVSRSIPERIRSVALREFEGEYGRVSEVYGQGATDLKRWQELEPSNTSGLQGGPNNPDDPIYALFVRGQFTVVGRRVFIPVPQKSATPLVGSSSARTESHCPLNSGKRSCQPFRPLARRSTIADWTAVRSDRGARE
jgi:hypothetical protein